MPAPRPAFPRFRLGAFMAALSGVAALACAGAPDLGQPEPASAFVRGAYLHGANGLAFDPQGRLHVASVMSRSILVIDVDRGILVTELDATRGVQGPDDLAFGPNGDLYWTDISAGEVVRLTRNGLTRSQRLGVGVNPIAFSPEGRLFVALAFAGDGLYELDPELREPPRLVARQLGWLSAMAFGPDGALYGPIWSNGQVVRIDPDRGEVREVGRGFATPAAVRFDSRGRLHIGDHQRGEIVQLAPDGTRRVVADRLPGLDNFAFSADDRLFVSNAQDGSVIEIGTGGVRRVLLPGGIVGPGGLAVLPGAEADSLIVADLFSLRELDSVTGHERSVERHVIGVRDGITAPQTVTRHGRLLVLSSWLSNRVQLWNPDTRRVVRDFDDFAVPLGAIWFGGGLVVAERGATSDRARVVWQRDDRRDVLLSGGLGTPSGLAARGAALYVADWFHGRVMRLCEAGGWVRRPELVVEGLDRPEGLAIDQSGRLLVVESGRRRLLAFDLEDGSREVLASGLGIGLEPPVGAPAPGLIAGVAVDSQGWIFVSGDATNEIYRIPGPPPGSAAGSSPCD